MNLPLKKILPAAIIVAVLVTPLVTHALQLLPPCAVGAGRCGLNDIVQTFVNFARIILGFVGSAVLVFFIYGGFVWLTSGGSTEKIKKGKDIVVNSVIGLVIVFAAYTIIQFVFTAFSVRPAFRIGQECLDGTTRGIYVLDPANPTGPPECVTSCGGALLPGYQCTDPAQGSSCVFGLCTGANQACCKPGT